MSDVFREIPLRIAGYSFGIAQSARFRFSSSKVDLCGSIGAVYVVAHLCYNVYTEQSFPGLLRTLCFEAVCTCIIPPVACDFISEITAEILWDIKSLPTFFKRWAPFVAGMMVLPVLYVYVDPAVDDFIGSVIQG